MRRSVVLNWEVTSFHGWGVYGLNLALQWSRDVDIKAVCAHPVKSGNVAMDPLSQQLLGPFLRDTAELVGSLKAHADGAAQSTGPVLLSLDDNANAAPGAHGVALTGRPTVGVVFFMSPQLSPEAVEHLKRYDLVVAGAAWNEDLLRVHGIEKVTTVLQGIDPALFHPAPRRGLLGDRFLVFSGGKLERRKAQDIVLAAFRIFAARHPEALLVTAWHSPWPEVARGLDVSGLAAPVIFRPDGRVDVEAWAVESGVPAGNVLDLGMVPNAALPELLREMDVAVFPNRCEPGTNLVAMEVMACGVPTILSQNTGHLDLIEGANCYPLARQGELTGREARLDGAPSWGESDIEEVVEALEAAYADRDEARRRGLLGAQTLSELSWARTAREMKAAILPMG
ncbi:MAG: mshA 8 [Phenylobacterium sp.]|nr:mshA 8 [Phenylobacterium sp.]